MATTQLKLMKIQTSLHVYQLNALRKNKNSQSFAFLIYYFSIFTSLIHLLIANCQILNLLTKNVQFTCISIIGTHIRFCQLVKIDKVVSNDNQIISGGKT